ncbi:uncharacterized protein VTP21DRAFT_2057 [Calcarisporiella thermophila]|uniref:uncharacterized protein n=1 Tax=Calcarisporiella thermophila TaxID=911321 RepID=UPI0037435653
MTSRQRDTFRIRSADTDLNSPLKLRSLEEMQAQLPSAHYRGGIFRGNRRLYLGLALIALFLLLLLNIPEQTKDFLHSPATHSPDPLHDSTPPRHPPELYHDHGDLDEMADRGIFETAGHYPLLVAITSPVEDVSRRMLIREYMFGNFDNLVPCRRYDGSVIYKFLVKDDAKAKAAMPDLHRQYVAESIEFDDIVEMNDTSEESIMKWAQSLADLEDSVTYDYLLIADGSTVFRVDKILDELTNGVIGGGNFYTHRINSQHPNFLVWGRFDGSADDNKSILVGSEAVATLLELKDTIPSNGTLITSAYWHYFHEFLLNANTPAFQFVEDSHRIVPWTNQVEAINGDEIAVLDVFLDDEFKTLARKYNIKPTKVCRRWPSRIQQDPDSSMGLNELLSEHPSVVVLTSSYVYPDMCMIQAAGVAADNKRQYAKLHDYAFVARSKEFEQQSRKQRKTVWGKLDAVEKVLPRFDWLFWLDMDAVIFNSTISVESLLKKFEETTPDFDQKHLIVARPRGDSMINAGVFLMRNSEWSRGFLRAVQARKDEYNAKFFEQKAMWLEMNKPEWERGALVLDKDDHTFNTFPNRYDEGDFIVHYAPDKCPASEVIKGVNEARSKQSKMEADQTSAEEEEEIGDEDNVILRR